VAADWNRFAPWSRSWRTRQVFQRRKFFQGRAIRGTDIKDICWFGPDGQEMSDEAWNAGFVKCLGVRLAGDLIGDLDDRGEPRVGDTLLLLFNAHHEQIPFALRAVRAGRWDRVLDTAEPEEDPAAFAPGDRYPLQGRALALLGTAIAEATPPAEEGDAQPSVATETSPAATGAPAD
jgi:isoamylase